MSFDAAGLASLLLGSLSMRPYVFGFVLVFLVAAARDLGTRRTFGLLLWGFSVAFVAEWVSTRIGIPFGLYYYTGATAGAELFLSNVPFFTPPSFVFLAYAALCLARWTLGEEREGGVVFLAGVLTMLLDVVIDPLAVRGDRWFLGRIFFYPGGGAYFGVPLSNFGGWLLVGWAIVGGYVWATRRGGSARRGIGRSPASGVALYYAVLLFNLAITAWIGERELLVAGILVHTAGILILYGLSAASTSRRLRVEAGEGSASRSAGSSASY